MAAIEHDNRLIVIILCTLLAPELIKIRHNKLCMRKLKSMEVSLLLNCIAVSNNFTLSISLSFIVTLHKSNKLLPVLSLLLLKDFPQCYGKYFDMI